MSPPPSSSLARGLLFGAAVALATVAPSCARDDAPTGPTRACGLVVWHKPASAASSVEIVGDWNGWKRPGVTPEVRDDGWRVAAIDAPAGEHAYAIVEDGVWLADKNVPMTADHEGKEVAFVIVPDCAVPALRVEGVDATPSGNAVVRATFLSARGGAGVAAGSVAGSALGGAGLTVTSVDVATGALRLEAQGLSRGKYIYSIRARDADGKDAEEAVATVWIEPEPWDPRDAIIYQVMVDRFRDGNGALAPPRSPSARAGGTLAGVRRALDSGELTSLGVNTLWLSPLYKNPEGDFAGNDGRQYSSYHGYWPTASRELDPRFTTEAELDAFMKRSHELGVRVLFDVVPNHVHEQHPWPKEHPDWFKRDCVCGQGACDWGTHIKTCWFAPYLPDLDWKNPDVARTETADVRWWFDRFGADGLRIDAVPMMPRSATRRIAYAVRSRYEHPGNVPYVLGENFTGPGGYQSLRYDLGPYGLDGSFHFPLMWTLRAVLADQVAPMSDIDASFRAGEKAWDGAGAVMGMMIDNHDVSRFASAAAGNAGGDTWIAAPQPLDPLVYAKQRVALATVLTLPGAPVLFYGDEIGLAGRSDPDCRRVMPAEAALLPAQVETRDFTRKVGRARACSRALRRGALVTISADQERFVFARVTDGRDGPVDVAIVALSRKPALAAAISLPAGVEGRFVDVVTGVRFEPAGGQIVFEPDSYGVHVLLPEGSACTR